MTESHLYGGMINYCQHLEHQQSYRGNGHHLAQKLARLALVDLLLAGEVGLEDLAREVEQAKTEGVECPFCFQKFAIAGFKAHIPQCSMR